MSTRTVDSREMEARQLWSSGVYVCIILFLAESPVWIRVGICRYGNTANFRDKD